MYFDTFQQIVSVIAFIAWTALTAKYAYEYGKENGYREGHSDGGLEGYDQGYGNAVYDETKKDKKHRKT